MSALNQSATLRLQTTIGRIACLAGFCLILGCLSPTRRIERHLSSNPQRPARIAEALRGRRLVVGMSSQEVRLAQGPPARTEPGDKDSGAVWHYDKARPRDDTLRSSAMWSLPIPFQTVLFNTNGIVKEVISYDAQENAQENTQEVAAAVTEAKPERPKRLRAPAVQTPSPAVPIYRPTPDELNVYGWPVITLRGLTGSGSARNAVLNGNLLESGESLGAVKLDAIYANGVVLEYRNQRAFLRPGETTGSQQEKGQP